MVDDDAMGEGEEGQQAQVVVILVAAGANKIAPDKSDIEEI